MADIKLACAFNSEYGNEGEAISGYARDFIQDMNYYVKEISDLVIKARLQARETDIRAKYALEYANRAIAEASSAHQVSEALAKTSRMIASLALEVSNNTDEYIDEFIDSFNSSKDSLNTSFLNEDSSIDSSKEDSSFTEPPNSDSLISSVCEQTCEQSKETSESISSDLVTSSDNGSIVQMKFQTTYPDTLPQEEIPKEINLSTVWEDHESSGNSLEGDKTEEIDNDLIDDEGEKGDLETKRKMLIYRDSKIALTKTTSALSGLDMMSRNMSSAETNPEVVCM